MVLWRKYMSYFMNENPSRSYTLMKQVYEQTGRVSFGWISAVYRICI